MNGAGKRLALAAIAVAMVTGAAPANAEMTRRDKQALTGIVLLGIGGAILADQQHRAGRDRYEPHPAYHPTENAVGTCVHRAKQIAKSQGAYNLQVNSIERVRELNDGTMRVVFYATGYYENSARASKVVCSVWGNDIVDFSWT